MHEMLGLFLSANVDDIKNGRQNAEPQTHMEEPDNGTGREHRTPICTQSEAKVKQLAVQSNNQSFKRLRTNGKTEKKSNDGK